MTSLVQQVDQYLSLRRTLGFKLHHEGFMLPDFARFVMRRGARITSELALKWATIDAHASLYWWNRRLSMARQFAKFAHARDSRHEIPSQQLLVVPRKPRIRHYLFTADDIKALMEGAREYGGSNGEADAVILGLLAATGMRVGEALGLDNSDIDWKAEVIVIRGAKFGKTRQIPIHPSTMNVLGLYKRRRDRAHPRASYPAFFLSSTGTRMHHQNFHHRYLRVLKKIGLATRHTPRPRLHDLRHTFIVSTLVDWYRAGRDVAAMLAALSTYVGHVNPSSTYWYLTATQDLLGQAVRRLERAQGGMG